MTLSAPWMTRLEICRLPRTTKYMVSPKSPSWQSVVPVGTCRCLYRSLAIQSIVATLHPFQVLAVDVLIDRLTIRFLRGDLLAAEEIEDGLIHGLHALTTTRLDQRGNLMRFAFPNHMSEGCCTDQTFDREHPPLTISPHQELLGDNAFERLCQHGADLALLFRRKDINKAVHRRGCGPRMQGAKD